VDNLAANMPGTLLSLPQNSVSATAWSFPLKMRLETGRSASSMLVNGKAYDKIRINGLCE